MTRPLRNNVPRGIYLSPGAGPEGEVYFTAVDSQGKRLYGAIVYDGHDSAPVERAMWDLLDRLDPPIRKAVQPRIRLVS